MAASRLPGEGSITLMIAPELLEVLCCPADRSPVRLATAGDLEA
jgi:hypothetical protein